MGKSNGRAVFLDRDGTLIRDVGYPKDPNQVQLLPDVSEALAELVKQGFSLVLVSNQSGIGRGWVTPEQAEQVHRRVVTSMAEAGIQLNAAFYCPHAPHEGCPCRKPSPGMLLLAANELDLDLTRSYMVGDKPTDIEAGQRAGCYTILLTAKPVSNIPDAMPDYVAACWSEVVRCILSHLRANS